MVKRYFPLLLILFLILAFSLMAGCAKKEQPPETKKMEAGVAGENKEGQAGAGGGKSDSESRQEPSASERASSTGRQDLSTSGQDSSESKQDRKAGERDRAETQGKAEVIILMTVDSLRPDHMGSYGNKGIKTPGMDSLAADSVLFERCLTPVPQDLPAHAAIMTGLYPEKAGVFDNAVFKLPESVETLAETLKKLGYDTAAFVGSSVLERRFGLAQGFDLYFDNFDSFLTNSASIFSERKAEEVLSQARDFLQNRGKGKKLFLWVHLNDPNYPFAPPAPFEKSYRGEVEYCDSRIQDFLTFLRSSGRYAASAILLTSDHGIALGEHNEKRYGVNLYESTVRVPLVIKFPASFRQTPAKVAATVGLIDIAPTLLALTGAEKREEIEASTKSDKRKSFFEGCDLHDLMSAPAENQKGGEKKRIYFLSSYHQFFAFGWNILRAVDDGDWKYIDGKGGELYKVSGDSKEAVHNISGDNREAVHMVSGGSGEAVRQPGEDVNQLEGNKSVAERLIKTLEEFQSGLSSQRYADNRPGYKFMDTRNLSYLGYSWCPSSLFGSAKKGKYEKLQEIEAILENCQLAVLNKTPRKVINEAKKIFEIDPENYLPLHLVVSMQTLGGRAKLGAMTVAEMERFYPDWPETYHMKGHLEIFDKKYDQALQDFARTIEIDPMNCEALYDSACMYSLLNQQEKALEFLDNAIELGYNDFGHIQEDPDLTNIRSLERYQEILNRHMGGSMP